jgi:hypothetical protein
MSEIDTDYVEDEPQDYASAAVPVHIISQPDRTYESMILDIDAWPLPLAGSGVIDWQIPQDGWIWDIRRLTVASFTAGTVTVYKNGQTDANVVCVFTSAGSFFFNPNTLCLRPHDHLYFVATGIVGSVTPSVAAVKVRRDLWARYLT